MVEKLESIASLNADPARQYLRLLLDDEIRLQPKADHLLAEFGLEEAAVLQSTGTGDNCGTEERT